LLTFKALDAAVAAGNNLLSKGGSSTGGKDFLPDLANVFLPAGFEDSARGYIGDMTYNEQERAVRGLATNAAEAFKRARTGANLTKPETVLGENWDPGAKGISQEEAVRRMIRIQDYMNLSFEGYGMPQREAGQLWTPGMKVEGRQQGGRKAATEPSIDESTESLDEQIRRLEEELGQ
jgi:hypothetical protein